MAKPSDEKALDLLARIIADEIWRQLMEGAHAGSDAVNDRLLSGREPAGARGVVDRQKTRPAEKGA